jgi:uncharacterized membrane-anchored protein
MSVFICSDKHFAVVARHFFAEPHPAQHLADHLKRENVKSYNARYPDQRVRFRKVNLKACTSNDVLQYDIHAMQKLLSCIEYQSTDHEDYDPATLRLMQRVLLLRGAYESKAPMGLWSI